MSDRDRYHSPSPLGGEARPAMPGQTCPRCSVSTISPQTGKCELCGYSPTGKIAVVTEDVATAGATRELAHEFEFGELLGRGKGSAVYRVRERNAGRSAILKVSARRPDVPDAEESFRAMLGMFATFDHPHLVPILRYGSSDSLFWFTTEDLGGTTLRHLLQERGALDARTIRRIATQVVGALDYLHRHGVVHGAIKVDNIILDKEGWVRVCDPSFLRARWKRRSRSTPSRGITPVGGDGSTARPPWVAPEDHERGERLPAADQYALGALLYECATAESPEAQPVPVLELAEGLPPQMARAIETAMSVEPFRRFGSLAEFLFALEARNSSSITPVIPNQASPQRRESRTTREVVMVQDWQPPETKKNPLVLIGRGLVAVVLVGAAAWIAPSLLKRDAGPATSVSTGAPSTIPSESRPDNAVANTPTVETPRPPVSAPAAANPAASNPARTTPRQQTQAPTQAPVQGTTRPSTTTQANTPATATPPATAPASPAGEPGKLFVNASPWGSVALDGVTLGNTPRANIEVAAGQHTLRITRAGFETVERTFRVAPGETVRMTDIVLVPVRP
jgi:serine/threonine protein kinase